MLRLVMIEIFGICAVSLLFAIMIVLQVKTFRRMKRVDETLNNLLQEMENGYY